MTVDLSSTAVLVVDDNDFSRRVITMTLAKIGITDTTAVEDGPSALHHLGAHSVDAVICDLNMPGMDGFAFIDELAAIDFTGGLIVVSSDNVGGLAEAEALARTHGLKFLGASAKPLKPEVLTAMFDGADTTEQSSAPTTASPSEPIDMDGLSALIGGRDSARISETIHLFRQLFPPLLAEIADAIDGRDVRALHTAAHKAKGAANNVAAPGLAGMLDELQSVSMSADWEDFRRRLDALRSEFKRIENFDTSG